MSQLSIPFLGCLSSPSSIQEIMLFYHRERKISYDSVAGILSTSTFKAITDLISNEESCTYTHAHSNVYPVVAPKSLFQWTTLSFQNTG